MPLKPKRRSFAVPLRIWRTSVGLWLFAGAVALWSPWPYALSAVLLVTFLQFALLDGVQPQQPGRRRNDQVEGEKR